MKAVSIISSLYKTERFIQNWEKDIRQFASKSDFRFEIIAIANDPSEFEINILHRLEEESWFRLVITQRESLYASWNRGVQEANYDAITFWNVDDVRYVNAIQKGLASLGSEADVVYFPFIYKRYVNILGFEFVAKRITVSPLEFDKKRFLFEMHCGPFFMFTKDIFEKVGSFDVSFIIAGDFEWCARASTTARFMKIEEKSGTLSGGVNPLQESENARIHAQSNEILDTAP